MSNETQPIGREIKNTIISKATILDAKVVARIENKRRHNPVAVTQQKTKDGLSIAFVNDRENYQRYTSKKRSEILLPAYKQSRKIITKSVRSVARVTRGLHRI